MKYDFDELIDRRYGEGSYSSKWAAGSDAPEDRLPFFLADMDFRVCPAVLKGMQKVLDHGIMGYSSIPREYYEAVARWMRDRFGWHIDPSHITVHAGAHASIVKCIEKFTAPGDGVIVLQPTYYYRQDVSGCQRHYVGVRMNNDRGVYTMDWERFEEACKEPTNTMIIMQQPHNPTGKVWSVEEIKRIGEICERNNVLIVSDDVHMDIKRKGVTVEPLMKVLGTKNVAEVTGLGKTFNLAGLSVSNLIVEDEELIARLGPVRSSTSPFGIAACIAAYTESDDWVDALNEYIDGLLDYALERFRTELPQVKVHRPDGTYILWLDFAGYGLTSDELSAKLDGEVHLSLSDGKGMEQAEGEIYRRMCLTSPKTLVADAIDRIVKALS